MTNQSRTIDRYVRERLSTVDDGPQVGMRLHDARDTLATEFESIDDLHVARVDGGELVLVAISGKAIGVARVVERSETRDFIETAWFLGLDGALLSFRRRVESDYSPIAAVTLEHQRIPGGQLHFHVNKDSEAKELVEKLADLIGLPKGSDTGPLVAFA